MYSQYNRVPRGLIYLSQALGTFVAVAMTLAFIVLAKDIFVYAQFDAMQEYAIWAIVIALMSYLTWKTIYTAVIICNFIKNHDDDSIIANKFVIATLSLSLGGFLTPMVLTRMPNVNSSSTINPKVWIGRHLGVTLSVGSILFGSLYFGLMASKGGIVFDSTVVGTINLVSLILAVIGITFGLLSNAFFCQKDAYTKYDAKNANGSIIRALSVIWLVIASIELIFVWIFALLRLLGAIFDVMAAFGRDTNAIMKVFVIMAAFARLAITMLYTTMIMKMVGETMVGIWSKNNVIEYHYYEALGAKQQELNAKK